MARGIPAVIVHRDLKPKNILIAADGTVKVSRLWAIADTGRQRVEGTLTGTHQVMGTPRYMAPERPLRGVRGEEDRPSERRQGAVQPGETATDKKRRISNGRLDEIERFDQRGNLRLRIGMIVAKETTTSM